ncbi:MAG: four helix bundle protein [Candidatus Omnitrophica bacterium]|nr:four helix bundle protein [Candidatus Omnitrophota bacterium]
MDKIGRFEDLSVWQKSHRLVLDIYQITKVLPTEEKFCLVPQIRRAAVSVAANIAEGFKRRGVKNKINFYNISQGSLNELNYYLILVKDLKYTDDTEKIKLLIEEIGRMLHGLIVSLNRLP